MTTFRIIFETMMTIGTLIGILGWREAIYWCKIRHEKDAEIKDLEIELARKEGYEEGKSDSNAE